jgi:hypothetical protein
MRPVEASIAVSGSRQFANLPGVSVSLVFKLLAWL